jgi:hypothetical protein
MKVLTEKSNLRCNHQAGVVDVIASQSLVTIDGRKVMVEADPTGRPISGCPNVGPTIKPCTATVNVVTGYSDFIEIEGRRVCLDTITGLTDGTPPGIVHYKVIDPGQDYVDQA